MKKFLLVAAFCAVLFASCKSCGVRDESKIGSKDVSLKISFMPGPDKELMEANAKVITNELMKNSGLSVEPIIAKSYMSIIDDLANKRTDAAFLNSLSYLLAHDWSGAEAIFQMKGKNDRLDYKSAIITRFDTGIKTINDINGRNFAYSDPFSLSGYLMPLYAFTEKGVKPAKTLFAGGVLEVIEMVYNGKVDAGAIYYVDRNPDGRINDARLHLVDKYKDMLDKVPVIFVSGPVPNSPIVIRKGLNQALKEKVIKSLEEVFEAPQVAASLDKMYSLTGVAPPDVEGYDKIREMLKRLDRDVKEVVPGAVDFYRKHFWEAAPDR